MSNSLRLVSLFGLILGAGFAALLVTLPAPADERDLAKRLSAREEPEAPFTWQRDRPFGVIGFPNGQFGPHWEFLRLATWPEVQEELDLSPEQVQQLEPVHKGLMSKQGEWSKGDENPDYLKQEYEAARRILTEEQSLRVEQIQVQRRGVQAFLHADMQETLGLSPKQIATIRETWDEHVKKSEKGWKGDEGRRSYHQVWRTALETLTEAQRRKYFAMTGKVIVRD